MFRNAAVRVGLRPASLLNRHHNTSIIITRNLHLTTGVRSSVTGIVATVFGATGFTGRYVIELLSRVGAQVIVPYRGEETSYNHIKVMGDLGQVVPMRFSLRDPGSIERAVAHSNVVINLLGRQWETRNFTFDDVHVKAARDIANASLSAERFIHVSALGASTDSRSPWARSKAHGEAAVREIIPHATIFRPTVLFGDEDRLINKFGSLGQTFPIVPVANATRRVQPVYAIDVAKAVLGALGDHDTSGRVYDLGGPKTYTWEELCRLVLAGSRIDKQPTALSSALADPVAWFMEKFPQPYYSRAEVEHQDQDLVVPSGSLGLRDLSVTPTTIDASIARMTRLYRAPIRFHEAVSESAIVPTDRPSSNTTATSS
eukprot:TRINITY_DN1051_c0_g1_i2.p1 TRINITY_DN1051_c0_g1~~TRINITY_DN1051_c0_g1_i2.p1  ORF type:complete len:381 (+),score=88.99 TRINITY_DN1051_c0_g1_i2:26-1144(+)